MLFFSKKYKPGAVIDFPSKIEPRRVFMPQPVPTIRISLRMVEEIGKAAERAARCLDETQLHDALRSVRYFLDEAEKRVGEESPAEQSAGRSQSAGSVSYVRAPMQEAGASPEPPANPIPQPAPIFGR